VLEMLDGDLTKPLHEIAELVWASVGLDRGGDIVDQPHHAAVLVVEPGMADGEALAPGEKVAHRSDVRIR
jgi:hypothetical protein